MPANEFQQQEAKHDAAAFKAAFPMNNNQAKAETSNGEQQFFNVNQNSMSQEPTNK